MGKKDTKFAGFQLRLPRELLERVDASVAWLSEELRLPLSRNQVLIRWIERGLEVDSPEATGTPSSDKGDGDD